jgi:O-acetylhomoserine/O-acetylserine sulfhydrylase-like pyridoxal-dependent enzyme
VARSSPSVSRAAARRREARLQRETEPHLANIGEHPPLIIHPASTTHRQLTDAQKVQAGAGPDVVRLSIARGQDDIIADPSRDWRR